jgi:Putative F0F1-ATPase subunit Ca2+/Mg2+ transporter
MPKRKKGRNSEKKPLSSYAKYSAIGFQMAVIIFIFTYGGYKLDHWLELKIPVFTLILSLAAIVLSIYYFIRDSLK